MPKKVNEGLGELADMAERDHEVQMARADLYKIAKYAIKLHDILKNITEEQGLEGWVQAKITKSSDYISAVYHNLDYDQKFGDGGPAGTSDPSETIGMKMSTEGKKYKSDAQRKAIHANKAKTESTDVYKTSLHTKLQENLQAKKILGEGKEYQIYLELSEAPLGDVVQKIKGALGKIPKNVVPKVVQAIKKVPKAKLAMAAGIIIAAANSAAAGDTSSIADAMQALQNLQGAFDQGVADLPRISSGGFAQGAADTAQATQTTTEIPMSQVRDAIGKLGGGSGAHVQDMLANGVDIDKVKATLDRMGVTSERDISNAISRIKGDNLLPMIQYIQQIK